MAMLSANQVLTFSGSFSLNNSFIMFIYLNNSKSNASSRVNSSAGTGFRVIMELKYIMPS